MSFPHFNPFAPELPITPCADPCPFYCLWHHQFWCSRTILSANLCRVKRSFGPYQNEHNSVKDTREKGKKHVTLTQKLPWKSCSTTHLPFLSPNPKILKVFLKTFPTKIKPTKCSTKEKKMRQEKRKKRGGEKTKSQSQNYLHILLSAHARTSQADTFASVSEGREEYDLQTALW